MHQGINMTDSTLLPLCPACRKGRLHAITQTEVFLPHGNEVPVELLASRCDACGVETTRASQHDENLRRLAARKEHYGGLLMGEEIVSLRKRYGLTQKAASRIFGKGKIAFSRYENEVTYPDEGTTLMLAMAIEKPDCLKWLADKAGVEIPLWRERCEDGRRAVRVVAAQEFRLPLNAQFVYEEPEAIEAEAQTDDGWLEAA
jgi:putative zinc finger/helix-turn-helix YgiT family protein